MVHVLFEDFPTSDYTLIYSTYASLVNASLFNVCSCSLISKYVYDLCIIY